MKLTAEQSNAANLEALGSQATSLLCSGEIAALAEQFSYALAYGREPALAIREELAACLRKVNASSLARVPSTPACVSYFKPNDTGLYALVEQRVPTNNGKHILLEFVVTGSGSNKHVTLEQVSVVP